MSKKLIIAEKPSVAADIARALGGFSRKGDYYESDRYVLSSAVGHLLELVVPDEYDVKRGKWSFRHLPLIPPRFGLAPLEKSEQRLNLLLRLKDEEQLALLFITHDIASARYFAEETLVMYAGQSVEGGPSENIIQQPKHPYTQLLLSAVADPREKAASLSEDSGEPPRVINPSEGCRFRWRCPYAIEKCHHITPRPEPIGSSQVACHVAVAEAEKVASS